jgi:hypothetical protein
MRAEVEQRLVLEERGGRGGDDDLSAVRERGDARSTVDVDSDVAVGRDGRRARVHPHPHLDGAVGKRFQRCPRGGRCEVGCGERDEEGIALGVDLHAAVSGKGLTQDTPMLG